MFNGHKSDGDGDPEGDLPKGNNDKSDRENGRGDRIIGKGQLDLFVSPISVLGTAFTTNTINNKQFLPLNKLCRYKGKEQGNINNIGEMARFQNDENS